MKDWKDNISFVLVEPREPGNIGASARAIKNMGFKNLCVVNPPVFKTEEALWFARGANDILDSALTFNSIRDAVGNKHFVAGTSRRRGRRRGAFIPVEKGVQRLSEIAHTSKVAILFGREDRGLFNEEVEDCGFLMTIPASRKQPSLNLAQAVMIIAYELSKAGINEKAIKDKNVNEALLTADPPKTVSQQELSYLYDRMEKAFKILGYIPPEDRFLERKIMQNLKHCLGRVGLTDWEFNMFHGICRQIEKKLGKDNERDPCP
jgi:TrmH family RNA methyltransferase